LSTHHYDPIAPEWPGYPDHDPKGELQMSGRGAEYSTNKTQYRSNSVKIRAMHSRYFSARYDAGESYLIDLERAWSCEGMHSHERYRTPVIYSTNQRP
jgi:hypothetical protein